MLRPTINSDAKPEGLEKIVVTKDEDVEKAVRIYHDLNYEELQYSAWDDIKKRYHCMKLPMLTPAQIDFTLQHIINKTTTQQTNHHITGLYITHLIQESYNAGNNNFTINTKDTNINCLADKLAGTKKQPLQLTIQGNTGNNCGYNIKHSQLTIQGNTRNNCGHSIKHSIIVIKGSAGYWIGRDAKKSIFGTNNIATYERLKRHVQEGNKIILYENTIDTRTV